MSEVERQYAYKAPSGPLLLLGWLMIVLAPLLAYVASQKDQHGMTFSGIELTPNQTVAAGWALAVVLLWSGVAVVRSVARQRTTGGRVAFTPTAFLFTDLSGDGGERAVAYRDTLSIPEQAQR